MSGTIRISLAHPLLVFLYSLSLFLLGAAIGILCHQSRSFAMWTSVAAAALLMLHDIVILFFASLVGRRHQLKQRDPSQQ
jgi:membrane protein YdbS with pleckstrin-like domain